MYEAPGSEHLSASDLQALLHQQQHQQMMGSNPDLLQSGPLEMLLQSAQMQPGTGEWMHLHSCKRLQSQPAAKPLTWITLTLPCPSHIHPVPP